MKRGGMVGIDLRAIRNRDQTEIRLEVHCGADGVRALL